jgi:hypothetical protein
MALHVVDVDAPLRAERVRCSGGVSPELRKVERVDGVGSSVAADVVAVVAGDTGTSSCNSSAFVGRVAVADELEPIFFDTAARLRTKIQSAFVNGVGKEQTNVRILPRVEARFAGVAPLIPS